MLLLLTACAPESVPSTPELLAPVGDGPGPSFEDSGSTEPDTEPDTDTEPAVEDPEPPNLLINEVMPENTYSLSVGDTYPDWVELYNDSVETVALSRVTLIDSSGRVWLGSEGELLPGTWGLVYADGLGEGLHAPFSIDNDGDTLSLQVDGKVTDRISTGEMDDDVVWARIPDGGEWAPTIWTTPGETNGDEASPTLDPSEGLFSLNSVHQVSISADASSLQSLNSSPRVYTEVGVTLGDTTVDPVGARLRGSMTYQSMSGKAAFKIDMNRYEDFRLRGQENIQLLNMYYEASLMREYLGYHIFREFGVPAARNSYAWVDVNGDDYGLYLLSQSYDDTWLREWYGNSDGYLWEPGSGDFSGTGSSWDCEEGYPCDNEVISTISSILSSSATDANVAELELYMDLDNVLREIAVELAIGQWDGYCAVHNYRVYWDPDTGLVTIIPSSLDLTFDNLGDYGSSYFSCSGRILSWCLSNESCEDRYVDILNQLADGIEEMELDDLIDEIDALIDDYAVQEATTRSQYNYSTHTAHVEYVRSYIAALPEQIRTAADSR